MPALLDALHKAAALENLTAAEAQAALDEILSGDASAPVVASLLTALRMKGESVEEVVGFARGLRERVERVPAGPPLLDTAGTGGDGAGTFNISTAAAFVAAGAGARVAKHGNRAVSSRCGSADVLEELGARIALPPARIAQCIDQVGIGFLFAPALHPAMRHVQPIRAELKMRTVFNLAGPLANPAGAETQLIGVFAPRLVRLMAEALAQLGARRALVVHGGDGLDEISICAPTLTAALSEGALSERSLEPKDFGVPPASPDALRGGDRIANAAIVRAVLDGQPGPCRDAVLVNASAALWVAGRAVNFADGMAQARTSIDSRRALTKLNDFVRFTQSEAGF